MATLHSQLTALTEYVNGYTGLSDTQLGDAVKHLAEGSKSWWKYAMDEYDIPYDNLITAYTIDNDISKSFNGVGRKLVSTDESSIEIDYNFNNNTILYLDMEYDGSTVWANIFGSGKVGSSNCWCLQNETASSESFSYYVVSRVGSATITLNKEHKIEVSDAKLSIDNDVYYHTASPSTISTTDGLVVLPDRMYGKWNIIKIMEDETLLHFLIPMLKDSVCGLYDLIGQQFYANSNSSGTFTIE